MYELLKQNEIQTKLFENNIHYHHTCYMAYTSKSNLKPYIDSSEVTGTMTQSTEKNVAQRSSSSSWKTCLICNQKKIKGDSNLHLIQSFDRADKLQAAATTLADEALLIKIRGEDLIAKEGLYHNGCMIMYLKKATLTDCDVKSMSLSSYDMAFNRIVQDIESDLFIHQKALSVAAVRKTFDDYLKEICPKLVNFTKTQPTKFRAKLQNHYGDRIIMHQL